MYKCYIRNTAGEIWSNPCQVTVYTPPRPEPSAKIALLIANQLYANQNLLFTPENDVKTLADLLQDLGFAVIALQNLNLVEMRNAIHIFSKMVPKDAYGKIRSMIEMVWLINVFCFCFILKFLQFASLHYFSNYFSSVALYTVYSLYDSI